MFGITRYKQKNTILNCEWQALKGGYLHVGHMNWVFMQRVAAKGVGALGNGKEFVTRIELALDHEDKYSWFSFEAINPYEARVVYIWIKLWKNTNLRFVLNIGWRLTRESRDFVTRQILLHNRTAMQKEMQAKSKLGGKNASITR